MFVHSICVYGTQNRDDAYTDLIYIKARDARRITAAEMKYIRRTAGYTWDRLQNKFTHCKGIRK